MGLRSLLLPLLLAALVSSSTGCSTRGMYEAGKNWQRNECLRIDNRAEREQCLEASRISYEEYRQQRREAE